MEGSPSDPLCASVRKKALAGGTHPQLEVMILFPGLQGELGKRLDISLVDCQSQPSLLPCGSNRI